MGRPKLHANPSERTKAWKLAHPERTRELNRESVRRWRERNPEAYAAARAAERASYGLTVADMDALWIRQDGRCAICHEVPKKRLHVDHDHATGRVRGLLCRDCNLAIGLLRDDPERLAAAIAYLAV